MKNGNPVEPGKVGELVIKQPWIGMARGFWQEKERYLETYWRRFKDIWVHGDFAMRDKDGHWFILGRRDDTLKVAGKRVGPAEVESILVAHPDVVEAAVIGVPDEVKGTAMVAFCVFRECRHPAGRRSRQDGGVPIGAEISRRQRHGQAPCTVKDPFRLGPSENSQCKGNATRYPFGLSRRRPRRPVRIGEPEHSR